MRNVLVIEDEKDIAHLVRLHLQDLPCNVELAFDGQSGLAAAEKKPFDLVVLDLMLPGIDGLEICRRLRARPPYTPIMMLTAKAAELDRVLGLELGADDYLTKPFSIRELVARVKALFRRIEQLENARRSADRGGARVRRARSRRREARSARRRRSRSRSRARNSICCCISCATPAASTRGCSSSTRCGATATKATSTT